MNKSVVIVSSVLLFSGCSISNPLVLEKQPIEKGQVYTTSAGVQTITTKDPATVEQYCASPAPDAAIDLYEAIGFELSLLTLGDDNDSEQLGMAQGSLGGRSPNVLITRELMYRFCEFYSNTQLTKQEKIDLYKTTLQTVADINKTALGVGSAAEATTDVEVSASKPDSESESSSDSDDDSDDDDSDDDDSDSSWDS